MLCLGEIGKSPFCRGCSASLKVIEHGLQILTIGRCAFLTSSWLELIVGFERYPFGGHCYKILLLIWRCTAKSATFDLKEYNVVE